MNALKSIFGYVTEVIWENEMFLHYSWTRQDALAWLACYPVGTRGCISRRGRDLSGRITD
jgi:hypothetical protein